MYVVQLSTSSTNNVGIYRKRGIVVFRNIDEYNDIKVLLEMRLQNKRKKRVYKLVELNRWLPSETKTLMLYVEYRFRESADWEKDLVEILNNNIEN